ncbi:MAG TPA: acyl carrier protein [Rhodocyclaceae bacterium]|nr:acyl carrier protein [Rhodocyclaceae bacterium]
MDLHKDEVVFRDVLGVLDDVLTLGGRAQRFDRTTPLLGSLPELDSMAVVGLITGLEERFGFIVEDDEIDGQAFASVGTLTDFVERKLAA